MLEYPKNKLLDLNFIKYNSDVLVSARYDEKKVLKYKLIKKSYECMKYRNIYDK